MSMVPGTNEVALATGAEDRVLDPLPLWVVTVRVLWVVVRKRHLAFAQSQSRAPFDMDGGS